MKNLKTEITIKAPVSKVWQVLMDYESYPEWNPFIKEVKGNTQPGGKLEATIQPPNKNPMQFTPVVLKNEANKEFRWLGHLFVKGLFDGEHYFQLEYLSENQTKLTQGENFTGVLAGLLLNMIGDNTLKGFELMNQALKERVEKMLS